MENHRDLSISRWLFTGPGFGLLVLLLSISLGNLVATYRQTSEDERKFLKSQIAALTALRQETEMNTSTARKNVDSSRAAIKKRRIPALLPYQVNVWEAISSTTEVLTLPATDYSALSLIYGQMARANRQYDMLIDRFLTWLPLSPAPLPELQLEVWRKHQATISESLLSNAEFIDRNLPLVEKVANGQLKQAQIELEILDLRSRPLLDLLIVIAVAGAVALIYLLGAALTERTRRRGNADID